MGFTFSASSTGRLKNKGRAMVRKRFYLTFDVDYQPGTEAIIPRILKFLVEKDVKATFFITGKFADENSLEVLKIADYGHSLGVHGWDHGFNSSGEDFYSFTLEEQTEAIRKAKCAIFNATGIDVRMNRNPNLWMNDDLWQALEKNRILLDSSVPAMRLFGQVRNLKNSLKLTKKYKISTNENYTIVEMPPTALILPFNTSLARYFGHNVFLIFQKIISIYSRSIVLYTHPAELMESGEVVYDLHEMDRYKKNTGPAMFSLIGRSIDLARQQGYEFCSMDTLIHED